MISGCMDAECKGVEEIWAYEGNLYPSPNPRCFAYCGVPYCIGSVESAMRPVPPPPSACFDAAREEDEHERRAREPSPVLL